MSAPEGIEFAYKVLTTEEHKSACELGDDFLGTELDHKDGYIHLSGGKAQAQGVLERYFKGKECGSVHVAVFKISELDNVKWEQSGSHGTFPHIYGKLPMSKAKQTVTLTTMKEDILQLPDDILA